MVALVTRNPAASRSTAPIEEGTVRLEADEYEGRGGRVAVDLTVVAVADHNGGKTAPFPLQLDDFHAGVNHELGIGPDPLLENGRRGQGERASTRTRWANSDRCSPSSRAELPPPITTTSSAPL